MVRKTKAELAAEREAEHQAQLAVAKFTYTERMMTVLAQLRFSIGIIRVKLKP